MLTCSGCGATIIGNPQPAATSVDIESLRPGPFIAEPEAFELKDGYGAPEQVRLIEGRRLLNYLIQPIDIDTDVQKLRDTEVFATHLGMPEIQGISDTHKQVVKYNVHFIAGVAASRTNGSLRDPKEVSVAVLQFDSNSESSRAAEEFNRISMEAIGRSSIIVPGASNTHSSALDRTQIDSWQSYGPYVILVSVKRSAAEFDDTVSKVKDALLAQNYALDLQAPTPLDDVLDRPLDPENIVRRTMNHNSRDATVSTDDFGPYRPSGILHFARNPAAARKAFEDAGVDAVGQRASTVYRTRDLAAAFRLQTFLAKPGKDDRPLDPPLGIADAQCVRFDEVDERGNNAFCAVVYGRFVAVVATKSIGHAQFDSGLQERAAAQYAILQKCE
ncbi:DUF7373 family lipoprotein [Nocardia rhizosphaerae]|uniref:Uncharacterized protein n=1 Tax=Nocardia rhizosphaerae TaxID=1691571 RepID=A0ABV8L2I4_9NOCA